MANFENISRETKRESFKGDEDRLQADTVKSPAIEIALKQKNLFAKGDDDEVEADVSSMEHVGTFLNDTLRIGRFPALIFIRRSVHSVGGFQNCTHMRQTPR